MEKWEKIKGRDNWFVRWKKNATKLKMREIFTFFIKEREMLSVSAVTKESRVKKNSVLSFYCPTIYCQ